MVLGKLQVPGRPTIWITVRQGPTTLAVGAGGVVWILVTPLSFLFPFSLSPLGRLKYCLKRPLCPKQPTKR